MKNTLALILVLALIVTGCSTKKIEENKIIKLHQGWEFSESGSDVWRPAGIPGCVHLDLMKNELIPDPFINDNEEKVQWVENSDWIYRTSFTVNDSILSKENIELVFEGLDTYAEVMLNGEPVLKAENMFREWVVPVKPVLRSGQNSLEIKFLSPVRINAEKASALPYQLPEERAFSRKAPYQFGWDWGPRLVTSGIWRPVFLRAWNKARVNSIQVTTEKISEKNARITAGLEIQATDYIKVRVDLKIHSRVMGSTEVDLRPGQNLVRIPLNIENPRLWWPSGYGTPFHYDLTAALNFEGSLLERSGTTFGIRTAELITEPDSAGESFYFRINGIPVFAKGANYIPQDNFLPRVTVEDHEKIIEEVRFANMNMLRVWGGGIYEEDTFYDLCDKNGIMVWQDFMFACTMYPGDSAFLENVRLEAEDNIKRLRNHPSIVLWCGNNEVDEGWHNWGWQEQFGYSREDSTEIWEGYKKLFHEVLPEQVARFDGTRAYWPSSPSIGWGHPESLLSGDSHYWGVWWGEEPFEVYEEKTGRFMSEYGFQGIPAVDFLEKYIGPEKLSIDSPLLRAHQKHPRGMELIRMYMERDYPVPGNFEHYAYVSRLVQAYGISRAIEAHRREKPYCMGTLYWQLNDCWPVISWSSIDYEKNRKALHYFVKKRYNDPLISTVVNDDNLEIHLVNDSPYPLNKTLSVSLLSFNGETIWSENIPTRTDSNTARKVLSRPVAGVLQGHDPSSVLLYSFLIDEGLYAEDIHYFVKPKNLHLKKPELTTDISKRSVDWLIKVSSPTLVKDLFLKVENLQGSLSDNYFDVIPGQEVKVYFTPDEPPLEPPRIRHISLYDTL